MKGATFSLRSHADRGLLTLDCQRPPIAGLAQGLHRTWGLVLRTADFDFGLETRLEIVRVLKGSIEVAGETYNAGDTWTVTPGTPLVFSATKFTIYSSFYPKV